MKKIRIGVLASGRGSNFQAIIDAVNEGRLLAEVVLLITDNPSAFAIERAGRSGIEAFVMLPRDYPSKDAYYRQIAAELTRRSVDLVVLAGFMRVVGKALIDAFPQRIMNIHPALLPSFPGLHGQGQAIAYGAKISGCTVHFVDEGVDTGPIILQAAVPVDDADTEDTLSEKILRFEHKIFPEAIRLFAEGRLSIEGRRVRVSGSVKADESLVSPVSGS